MPILFIHGDKDKFVPFYMLNKLYDACKAPKDKLSLIHIYYQTYPLMLNV